MRSASPPNATMIHSKAHLQVWRASDVLSRCYIISKPCVTAQNIARRLQVHPRPMSGLLARATALTKFVWKRVDLYGSAQSCASNPFMEGGCNLCLHDSPTAMERPQLLGHVRAQTGFKEREKTADCMHGLILQWKLARTLMDFYWRS